MRFSRGNQKSVQTLEMTTVQDERFEDDHHVTSRGSVVSKLNTTQAFHVELQCYGKPQENSRGKSEKSDGKTADDFVKEIRRAEKLAHSESRAFAFAAKFREKTTELSRLFAREREV